MLSSPIKFVLRCGSSRTLKVSQGKSCQLLIKSGADLNIQDDNGNTALLWASCRGSCDAIKVSRRGGCSISDRIRSFCFQTARMSGSLTTKDAQCCTGPQRSSERSALRSSLRHHTSMVQSYTELRSDYLSGLWSIDMTTSASRRCIGQPSSTMPVTSRSSLRATRIHSAWMLLAEHLSTIAYLRMRFRRCRLSNPRRGSFYADPAVRCS